MHVMERATARWIPPEGTVEAVAAGQFWDAVAVPQYIGLAALEILDQPSRPRLGPVIWDSSGRPRMYFLIPLSSPLSWTHERLLAAGSFVTVPGRTTLGLPGPFWIVPPDPDDPGALVDACLLRRALDRMRTAAVAEYHPEGSAPQRMLVTLAQLHAAACIVCGAEGSVFVPASHAVTPPSGPGQLAWAVVACAEYAAVAA
ncbi:hypothetical protein ABH930_006910 [Kitasatospora sp. GAS204A]|uniref:hypothetical protein n=1 Tax=unclassified Kitasatospora TaxID=2633591 RepID=UPI0024754E9B|nr:hypothetical protein [Kitasatospora sp. GAS204B]MDH6121427.1 hypothetical protein [Kitasatospora sp. GAS204B]